ncbi:hypothetical protein FO519_006772 [Halicephalobus sp. NKZ332]|nr:hypothetical protein FO519_006772 [Halicephalobus sp. NKZ332]
MGHRYSHHGHCHSVSYDHCHGYSRSKACGYRPCCCHHPRFVMSPTVAGIMWMRRRHHRRRAREMQFCECGGYVAQPRNPPPRPPQPAIMAPESYSPITPYPQVPSRAADPPYPSSSNIQPSGNPYQQKPIPMPEPGFPSSSYNPQQQSPPPRSHSPPPPYDFK